MAKRSDGVKFREDKFFEIETFHDYLSPKFAKSILEQAREIVGLPILKKIGNCGGLNDLAAFEFVCELYQNVYKDLGKILNQRKSDRKFLDERIKACFEFNETIGRKITDADYNTVIGLEDAQGRVVFGSRSQNSFRTNSSGSDSHKSKLDLQNSIRFFGLSSVQDLTNFDLKAFFDFDRNLQSFLDSANLSNDDKLFNPVQQIGDLALPCPFLFINDNPMPSHLLEFAINLFEKSKHKGQIIFAVSNLQSEEEAAYLHLMIRTAEKIIQRNDPSYAIGSVRILLVFDNPRSVLCANEIIHTLESYFEGAAFNVHDYLGAAARTFKEDANYRIKFKDYGDGISKHLGLAQSLLKEIVNSRGGFWLGLTSGFLNSSEDWKSKSNQVALNDFVKDVLTQLKWKVDGFWTSDAKFIDLIGAIKIAWDLHQAGQPNQLKSLVRALLLPELYNSIEESFFKNELNVAKNLDSNDLKRSFSSDLCLAGFSATHYSYRIREIIFQCLQDLTELLSGNALESFFSVGQDGSIISNFEIARFESQIIEVWSSLKWAQCSSADFLVLAHEELKYIRKGNSDQDKFVRVKWDERTEKWYPVSFQIMLKMMTDKFSSNFLCELLMPFANEGIRGNPKPLIALQKIDSSLLTLSEDVQRFVDAFEVCGSKRFALAYSKNFAFSKQIARDIILAFSDFETIEAASFQGDIGEAKIALSNFSVQEHELIFTEKLSVMNELRQLAEVYLKKFGIKFLVSARGRTGLELLHNLKERINNSFEVEMQNAREAIWKICEKRLLEKPLDILDLEIEELRIKYKVDSLSLALINRDNIQAVQNTKDFFQLASLSKTIASAFAIDYFAGRNISLDTSVNFLLAKYGSDFRLKSAEGVDINYADQVKIENLMNHSALNMHYVNGIPLDKSMPNVSDLIFGNETYGYKPVEVLNQPGKVFSYSGGGFLVLEHLIEIIEGKSIQIITQDFLQKLTTGEVSFDQKLNCKRSHATGFFDDGRPVVGGRMMFPAFAAGAQGTAKGMALVLQDIAFAYQNLEGGRVIAHDVAVRMLHGTDRGCRQFMGCNMGIGVFVADCGENKLMLHQGANEGFRALFVHCFDGPDFGKGFVIICNADNRAVLFISEVAQRIFARMNFKGVDFNRFQANLDFNGIAQEQIVNQGYKKLIFEAFEENLPERIYRRGVLHPLSSLNLLAKAKIEFVSNQKFARSENMISVYEPVFDPELFGRQGKIMDSWESARHNQVEFDQMILSLISPSRVQFVEISTKYHDGNHPEFVRILVAGPEQVGRSFSEVKWQELVPKIQMVGHGYRKFKIPKAFEKISLVKVEIYPDGGLSRLALYDDLALSNQESEFVLLQDSKCHRFDEEIPKTLKSLSIAYRPELSEIKKNWAMATKLGRKINLASLAFGAKMLKATNEHYGPAIQLLSPYPPINMFDGIESARSRKAGHFEEVHVELAKASKISLMILDFKYFVNNNPMFISLEGKTSGGDWVELVPKTSVKAFAGNKQGFKIESDKVISELRLRTLPDGGVNRMMIYE